MLAILNIDHVDKYLNVVDIDYDNVTHCHGTLNELSGKTDNKVPFRIKFSGKNTMVVAHGSTVKRYDFNEDNYPL